MILILDMGAIQTATLMSMILIAELAMLSAGLAMDKMNIIACLVWIMILTYIGQDTDASKNVEMDNKWDTTNVMMEI